MADGIAVRCSVLDCRQNRVQAVIVVRLHLVLTIQDGAGVPALAFRIDGRDGAPRVADV